jgi:hypothetical protein
MARTANAYRTTGVGSATLPMTSIYSLATGDLWLVEVGITNTTVTAFEISLARLTSAGTQGAAAGAVTYEEGASNLTAKWAAVQAHTVAPGLGAEVRRASIGASIGSGIIWTFGGRGLLIPSGTANGLGLITISGTGQISDVYWSLDQLYIYILVL